MYIRGELCLKNTREVTPEHPRKDQETRGKTRTPEVTPRNPWAIVDFIDGARDFQDFWG